MKIKETKTPREDLIAWVRDTERARRALSEVGLTPMPDAVDAIARQIQEAVANERKRCASIAEPDGPPTPGDSFELGYHEGRRAASKEILGGEQAVHAVAWCEYPPCPAFKYE